MPTDGRVGFRQPPMTEARITRGSSGCERSVVRDGVGQEVAAVGSIAWDEPGTSDAIVTFLERSGFGYHRRAMKRD